MIYLKFNIPHASGKAIHAVDMQAVTDARTASRLFSHDTLEVRVLKAVMMEEVSMRCNDQIKFGSINVFVVKRFVTYLAC